MDKKGLLLVYIIALILTFIINVLLNIALPAIGNNVSIFLTVSMLCMIFAWSYEEEKTSYIYTTGANSVILLFVFFTGSAIYETMNSLKLEPSFGNYLMVIFGFGIKNFSLSSIFSLPGVFWFMIFNYAAVYVINTINRNILFLRNKVKEAMNNIKEINKYKTDIERYEKTIEELQNKVVELSSRTLVLKDFASEIGSSFEPKEIFNSIIEATIKLLDAEQTMVLVFDRNKKLRISASHNIDPEEAKKLSVNASDGIIGMILKNHSIITREDIDKNFQLSELYKMDNVEIQIAAPIESEERQIYAVLVINRMKNRISKEHIRMFSILLNIATLSLENSKLFKKVEFMANVDGLTKLYTHRFFQEFLSEEIARAT
ncbi:MAG: GAF domain-containing protein, partial [Candidatus Muiribacteriota bacterium]